MFARPARVAVVAALSWATNALAAPADYFAIRFTDDATGRGVPLVELTTTYKARYVTDSAGYVAFLEPGLMDQEVWFDVSSYGYASPKGAFGTHGVALHVKAGGAAEIKLHREQVAERLYRVTGYGVYRDSALLNKPAAARRELIPGLVTGQDTVQTVIHKGKMFWMWQDTNRAAFPLGNFHMTAATSDLPDKLNADEGIHYTYFTDKPGGFVKGFAQVEGVGNHPVWVDGLMSVPDAAGTAHLLGRYAAVNADMSPVETGLVQYDETKEELVGFKKFPDGRSPRLAPSGHPFGLTEGGKAYLYFSNPYPCVRVPATFEAASDPAQYEGYVFNPGATGGDRWTWQRGVNPTTAREYDELVKSQRAKPEDDPFQLRDATTRDPIRPAGGSVAWNPYLKRYLFLFGQTGGTSFDGEMWLASSPSPEGPWRDAVKVATHAGSAKRDRMDLYNPMQHPELARENGRVMYFEGTYVNTFSGNPVTTPYYDYNQLMYRVDLADPRLKMLK